LPAASSEWVFPLAFGILYFHQTLENVKYNVQVSFSSEQFARAFGDSLKTFLDSREIKYAEAARRLGVTRATLATYWTDDNNGNRKKARVELLFRACVDLGFEFEYNGFRIKAGELASDKSGSVSTQEHLFLDFSRQFNLTEDDGRLSVRLKRRQPGRVEIAVSLEAAS
jgi:transcriptional regulator with XRE-family HTH domain